jgi:hypothetical protein
MSGLSYLRSVPKLVLEDPAASAALIVKYLNSPAELRNLSTSIVAQAATQVDGQDRAWRSLLRDLLDERTPGPA